MPTIPIAPPTAAHPFRWSRARYDRLAETGVLEGTHVELIDGELLEIEVTHSPRHASSIVRATDVLRRAYPQHLVLTQLPLALTDQDEPEPDVAVVAGTIDDYATQHPTTAVLVVEVSDTSLPYDRTAKAALYARSGIPTYWIIDLVHDCVEVRTGPTLHGYERVEVKHPGDGLLPEILVDDLLPRR